MRLGRFYEIIKKFFLFEIILRYERYAIEITLVYY